MHDDGDEHAPMTFRIATMPGVIVSKWTRVWAERRPTTAIDLVRTDESTQVAVLHEHRADVSFVRLPVERTGLSLIPLYTEAPVVVLPIDHELTLLDEVALADLAGEHLVPIAGSGSAESIRDAVALVAAGVGVLVVPMSIARMLHRKDVTHRPVTDAEPTQIGLAWPEDRTTADVEEFVGIVRGRTARSSRAPTDTAASGAATTGTAPEPRPGRAQGAGRDRRRTGSDPRRTGRPGPPRGRRGGKR